VLNLDQQARAAIGVAAPAPRRLTDRSALAITLAVDLAIVLAASGLFRWLVAAKVGSLALGQPIWAVPLAFALVAVLALRASARPRMSVPAIAGQVAVGCMAAALLDSWLGATFAGGSAPIWLGYFWLLLGVGLVLGRALLAHLLRRPRRTLVIGSREECGRIERLLQCNADLACVVQDMVIVDGDLAAALPVIEQRLGHGDLDFAILGQQASRHHGLRAALDILVRRGIAYNVACPLAGARTSPPVARSGLGEDMVLFEPQATARRLRTYDRAKRVFDILAAGLALIFVAPLLLLITVLVRLDGGPAFYGSPRIGRDGVVFDCLKFRSMVPDAAALLRRMLAEDPELRARYQRDFKLDPDPRITRLGRWLRVSSVDELPQLLNVLEGDMSLIGPRPLLPAEVEAYGAEIALYHQVRPGISGVWQVSGRNGLDYEERIRLNSWYVSNRSFRVDMDVMLKTVPAVLGGSGN
jgi:lipopolysaccharide/colanic/teichoic acid biosynthesis glycosyltransferase